MPIFTIETPTGQKLRIEAPDEQTALRGAQEYSDGTGNAGNGAEGARGHNVPEFRPVGVEGYDPKTGEVSRNGSQSDALGGFIAGANDMPILGPLMQRGVSAGTAAVVSPFSEKTFGDVYDETQRRQKQLIQENPGAALAGNVAGSMAVMSPIAATSGGANALGMSGTLGHRTLMSGLSGAGISGADTAIRGGNASDIAASAVLGGGISAAIPGTGELVKRGYQGVKNLVAGFVRGAANPAAEAGRRVGNAIQADIRANPQGILGPDDLAAAQRNAQPVMNADRGGETTRALARASANYSPEAREAMQRTVSDRFAEQGNRVVKMVTRLTGGKTDDLAMIDSLKAAAAKANSGAYNRAFMKPAAQSMWNEGYEQLMQAPAMRKAAADATARGANRAAVEGFQPVKNPFVEIRGRLTLKRNPDGSIARPTLQFWDQVKKNLDDQIGTAQRSGERSLAGDLAALKNRLVGMLDDSVPDYKAARQGAAAFFGAEDAVEAGKAFAKSTRMLPEYKRGILAMKAAERDAFETGFASELIDAAKNAGDRVNVINRMFGSPETREKMVMAFGQERAREIEAFVRVENAMDMLRGAFGNSTTTRQLIEAGVVGGGTWAWTGDYQKGITAAAVTAGLRYGGKKINDRILQETAKILLSSDPTVIERAVRLAAKSPQHMAAVDALTKSVGLLARSTSAGAIGQR